MQSNFLLAKIKNIIRKILSGHWKIVFALAIEGHIMELPQCPHTYQSKLRNRKEFYINLLGMSNLFNMVCAILIDFEFVSFIGWIRPKVYFFFIVVLEQDSSQFSFLIYLDFHVKLLTRHMYSSFGCDRCMKNFTQHFKEWVISLIWLLRLKNSLSWVN